jgi:hypothetical protein
MNEHFLISLEWKDGEEKLLLATEKDITMYMLKGATVFNFTKSLGMDTENFSHLLPEKERTIHVYKTANMA